MLHSVLSIRVYRQASTINNTLRQFKQAMHPYIFLPLSNPSSHAYSSVTEANLSVMAWMRSSYYFLSVLIRTQECAKRTFFTMTSSPSPGTSNFMLRSWDWISPVASRTLFQLPPWAIAF